MVSNRYKAFTIIAITVVSVLICYIGFLGVPINYENSGVNVGPLDGPINPMMVDLDVKSEGKAIGLPDTDIDSILNIKNKSGISPSPETQQKVFLSRVKQFGSIEENGAVESTGSHDSPKQGGKLHQHKDEVTAMTRIHVSGSVDNAVAHDIMPSTAKAQISSLDRVDGEKNPLPGNRNLSRGEQNASSSASFHLSSPSMGQNETRLNISVMNHMNVTRKADYNTEKLDLHYVFRTEPYPAYWVDGNGSFLDRVRLFNVALSTLRRQIKEQRGHKEWKDIRGPLRVLWGKADDFLQRLSAFRHVKTLSLAWLKEKGANESSWSSLTDTKNVLLQNYYEWVGSEPLCTWIRTTAGTKARWDAVYDKKCTSDTDSSALKSLEVVYLHSKPINPKHYWPNDGVSYPRHFYTQPPDHVFYVNVFEDAVITGVGDVMSDDLKLVPYACSHNIEPVAPMGYPNTPIYSEVFIISQFWGTAHFHRNLELVPRIAPYVDFLRENKGIKVHAAETGGLTAKTLKMLGISPEKLITGVCRAKIVYMPRGTPCGFPLVQELQLLSKHYRDIISRTRGNVTSSSHQRALLLIERTGSRRFRDYEGIRHVLKELASEYQLHFILFSDRHLPTLEETMLLFNRADLVVGPHGAGLANVLFCEPGSYVIEGVCNRPHVNMCFQKTAHILGMRYHGIPSQGGCEGHVDVPVGVIESVARIYLEKLKSRSQPKQNKN